MGLRGVYKRLEEKYIRDGNDSEKLRWYDMTIPFFGAINYMSKNEDNCNIRTVGKTLLSFITGMTVPFMLAK